MSVVGLGTWQLGDGWGDVREEDAFAVLDASVAEGVTFFDTADEHGDGRSEQLIGAYLRERRDAGVFVGRERQAPWGPGGARRSPAGRSARPSLPG